MTPQRIKNEGNHITGISLIPFLSRQMSALVSPPASFKLVVAISFLNKLTFSPWSDGTESRKL